MDSFDNHIPRRLEDRIEAYVKAQKSYNEQANLHPRQPPSLLQEPRFSVDPIEKFTELTCPQKFADPSVGPIVSQSNLPLCYTNNMLMCSTTVVGSRPDQQDRYVMAPSLLNGELSLFAVFDGTTGDYAAEWLRVNCIPTVLGLEAYRALGSLLPENRKEPTLIQPLLTNLIQTLYYRLDRALLEWCAYESARRPPEESFKYDYTASTGVITLIHHPSAQLCISHVADSHAVIAAPQPGLHPHPQSTEKILDHVAFSLTKSHKPDEREELVRINQAGGQLVYLHDQKPFIRGKDFRSRRKAIQLNYSRAFGSKDLKHSGLIAIPDITMIPLRSAPQNALAIKLHNERTGQSNKTGDSSAQSSSSSSSSTTTSSSSSVVLSKTSTTTTTTIPDPEGPGGAPKAEDSPAIRGRPTDDKHQQMTDGQYSESPSSQSEGISDNTPLSQTDPINDLEPVLVSVDNSSIHSPSVPFINTGLSMGSNIDKGGPGAGLFNINDDDSGTDSESPQQGTKTLTVEELARLQGVSGSSVDQPLPASSASSSISDENSGGDPVAKQKAEILEKYAKLFDEQDSIRRNFPFPMFQTMSSFHDVNRLQHSPALRMVQGVVDVRALVIGSDGVFDVLSPHAAANTALSSLSRCLEYNCHAIPGMQHIPPGQLQNFISQHHDLLVKLRTEGAISIYPDFIAHCHWMEDKHWNYSPSDAVVAQALFGHELRRSGDNVTCLVVFF